MVTIAPGSSLGRYRVIEQIGQGGMATVFRAHDPTLDRDVAIKVLPSYHMDDPTFADRFAQEARTAAGLKHANILQIYDFGEDKGFTYIVTELVTGGTFQDKLGSEPLSVAETIRLMGPLAEALDYAHAQGIIHRDIKPANVLLDEDQKPILADFGLARMLEASIRLTQASQTLGTPEFMSPEQAMGADTDHRSDIYAFGVILYQMLVGRTPFSADTPAATLMAHVHMPVPLPSRLNADIKSGVEAIILKALAKNPNDRFNNSRDIIGALRVASGEPGQAGWDDGQVTEEMDPVDSEPALHQDAPTDRLGSLPAIQPSAYGAPPSSAPAAARERARMKGPFRIWAAIGAGTLVIVALVVALVVLPGDAPQESPQASKEPEAAPAPAISAAAQPAPTPGPTSVPTVAPIDLLSALPKIMDEAEANVVKLRGIELEVNANVEFKSREDLKEITQGFFRRPDIRQQVFEAQELYKALGLMAEDDDLEEILTKIQLQQVNALFDDQTEKVYVVLEQSTIGATGKLAYALAYMGAVQQELFDIAAIRQRTRNQGADAFRAANALIMGDVSQVSAGYIATALTGDEARVVREPVADSELLKAPRIVRETVLFPFQEGGEFIAQLFGEGGWEAVNSAYSDPPVSTEQVLHIQKYIDREEPHNTRIPDISADLGKGWNQVASDTMGEFILRVFLEEYLDLNQASNAAMGWGGDQYSLLNGPLGERLLISMISWDTFQDAAEFLDAFQVFMGVKYQGVEGVSSDGDQSTRQWVTPDETVFVGRIGPAILWITGESRAMVGEALELVADALQPDSPVSTPQFGVPGP